VNPFASPFGSGIRASGIPMRVSVHMFFDRAAVKGALSEIKHAGLQRAAGKTRDIAVRSIKKRGMARPLLKIMKANSGKTLGELAAMPGVPLNVQRQLHQRISEITNPKGSRPGTPPFTHVPWSHMLGFRRNLVYGFDIGNSVAVVGPTKKGEKWGLPHLHEVGGRIEQTAWELNYKFPLVSKKTVEMISKMFGGNADRYREEYGKAQQVKRVFRWVVTGKAPRNRGKWRPTSMTRMFRYPARPFMYPAMIKAIERGYIEKAFQVRVGY